MTHGPPNGTMADFVYDSKRRLTQAGTVQYVYDAENHRIGVNGTRFVVNSQPVLSQVLVKTAADGAQTFYVYGLGLIGEESAAGYKAYHFDFRGSTVALSDESGAVSARFSYSAYGVLLSGDASLTPFLFNGMYGVMTDANGLYHMRARFYSAEIRRFLNRDVVLGSVAEGQSLNRFGFVEGGVIKHIDPFGLFQITPESVRMLRNVGIIVTQADSPAPGPADLVGVGLIVLATGLDIYLSINEEAIQESCSDDDVHCSMASPYQLAQAGIDDAHEFKREYVGGHVSRYDICACEDGSIKIAGRGQCGKSGPKIDTWATWK